ncbi:MAG: ParA family protein [Methylobacteriaceae bacterium]
MSTKYGIWNNKGGVGKSTITYHVASTFAAQNPDKNVLVIDLCPQANVSMMLLGGGVQGENAVLNFCTEAVPRTVVGYLSEVLSGGERAPLPDPMNFVTRVRDVNPHMTENLYLLSGDGNLEPMAPAITRAADAPPLTPASKPWRWVHEVFRRLIDNLENNDSWHVFVDTNPSFSIYTELAISSCDKLIVPVNADDSSRVATNAMFILLHGTNPPHPVYGSWTFAARAQQNGVSIPKVHLIVGNRLTSYDGVAGAFEALSAATADTLFVNYRTHPGRFTQRNGSAGSVAAFRALFSVPLRDFNTAGVMSAHLGMRIDQMKQSVYQAHGQNVHVKAEQLREAKTAINKVIAAL